MTSTWKELVCGTIPATPSKAGLTAVVVGSAPGWLVEAYDARKKFPDADLFAVNKAGICMAEEAQYWVTVHPEDFFPQRFWHRVKTISDKPCAELDRFQVPCVDEVWNIPTRGGSSSLLAVLVARAMGYERCIIAGIHLQTEDYQEYREAWVRFYPALRGWLKTMAPAGYWMHEWFGGVE